MRGRGVKLTIQEGRRGVFSKNGILALQIKRLGKYFCRNEY